MLLALVASVSSMVGLAGPASAATGNMPPPFDTGQTWNICRGYNYASHTGTSLYGLDLTGSGCDNSAAGRHVLAPLSGTLAYPYDAPYGNVCVNITGSSRSYTLTHIELANRFTGSSGSSVTAGQWIGTVAAAGNRGNNGLAHLHFQIWAAPGCYNSSVIPFDSVHSARICGAPDLTATGPNGGNGIWSGTSFTGANCGASSTDADRTLLQSPGGAIYVMAGGAKFQFGSMPEFTGLGYSAANIQQVTDAVINAKATIPVNRTLLQSGGGQIYVVAGGAKFYFSSTSQMTTLGYSATNAVKVPQAPLNAIGDAPGNKPQDSTLLKDAYGNIYVMAGGVRFQFGSMPEFTGLGYSTADLVNVPEGPLYQLGYAPGNQPANGTLLKDGTDPVYVMAGGVRFQASSMIELSSLGYGSKPIVAVPTSLLGAYSTATTTIPPENTLLQGTTTDVFVVKSGVVRRFVSMQQLSDMGYNAANIARVPQSPLDGLPHGGDLP